MRKIIDIFLLIHSFTAISIFCQSGIAADTKTNLEILERLYYDLFDEAFSYLPGGDTLCIIERPPEPVDYAWVIENQLYKRLQKYGVRHIYVNKSIENSMKVSYKPVSQTILYDRIVKKQFERKIDIQIYCQITDSQQQLQYSDLLQRMCVDSVAVAAKYLENTRFPFTIGTKKKSIFAAIYEPVIIISITGLVIFLFYSYRSQ